MSFKAGVKPYLTGAIDDDVGIRLSFGCIVADAIDFVDKPLEILAQHLHTKHQASIGTKFVFFHDILYEKQTVNSLHYYG